ncbi:F-box protein [Vitis vinifera]|uniref:F-box protein n=1 Tax=Vitis vinifera TaxID=29760 RepID=A0A438H9B3_VITVI|nr:F-box protein [Vitis vinifera]
MRTLEESSSQESSAHIVASNDDLLSELLLRLPIKSLLKFKSVSKHWLSLITDPHFSRRKTLSLTLSPPSSCTALPGHQPLFSFVPLDPLQTSAPFTSLTFVDHPRGIEILQSCNGLFCCSSVDYNDSERKYYIYNPTTKQFTTLPPLCGRSVRRVLGVNLAFDPSKSHTYRVVCVQRCKSSYDHCQIQIYSSETGPWRVSGVPFAAPISVDFPSGVYWNGAIHWISPREASLYFDLNEELVREMPMPPVPDDSNERGIRYFGESCGHLHLVEIYESSTTQFNVYEMERDHSGWFVKFRVDLNGVALAFPGIIEGYHEEYDYMYSFSVLCVVRREKEEDSFLALHIPGKVIGYNFSSKSYQTSDTDCPLAFGWSYAFQYIESLSLV